ncbi:MAG: damage-control phosphatase ARMT1 family protein [Desulfovibrio sp.]
MHGMKITLDCLPCFMKMAVRGARYVAPNDLQKQTEIIQQWNREMAEMDMDRTAPAIARDMLHTLAKVSGNHDPFREDKDIANKRVMELLPHLREIVQNSDDPLATAIEMAIIGNYMDSGAAMECDWEEELKSLEQNIDPATYKLFISKLKPGAKVLILGDNAGEVGIDTLLVDQLQKHGCNVTYAVRSGPALNDALIEDAHLVGMTDLCEVVESGADSPGTELSLITDEFRQRMEEADVLLSKGQGNFECLFGTWPEIFFAFKVKCSVIVEATGFTLGQSMFIRAEDNHF